jgi:hypothetical protein
MKNINKFLKIGMISIVLNIFLGIVICSADTTLNITLATQEHSNWCGVASSKMVLSYYGNILNQCDIANWAYGRSDCCGNTTFDWSHSCNPSTGLYIGCSGSTNCLHDIEAHWGVSSTDVYSALTKNDIVSEINACRPFILRFGWSGGGGHFLVGYGYDQNGDYVDYMDPLPGYGATKSTYDWTVKSSGHHDWTHTLKITTPHDCPLPTSCPSLYYWNGKDFEFVSSIFPGTATSDDPRRTWEYTDVIPVLKNYAPSDGAYLFQIRENEKETSYIDNVRLVVLDHNANLDLNSIFSDIGWYNNAELILKLLQQSSNTWVLPPLYAVHSLLGDVTLRLSDSDDWYVPMSMGDIITLAFQELPLTDEMRDFIFIVEGYYQSLK